MEVSSDLEPTTSQGRMKSHLSFMKSRVANRIFYLFIICALLPIGLLAFISLDQLAEDQNKESFQKLHQVSKNIGMSILEGLSLIRAEMQIVALQAMRNCRHHHLRC